MGEKYLPYSIINFVNDPGSRHHNTGFKNAARLPFRSEGLRSSGLVPQGLPFRNISVP